jgi:hypothetical protein
MKIVTFIDSLMKKGATVRKVCFVGLGLLVVFDVVLSRENAHYFVDKIPAFWTIFTLAGCFVLIKVSKGIAHMFLGKDEDYYG